MRAGPERIRVLVVDDSAVTRLSVRRILEADPEIEVVDAAIDGLDALLKVERLQPDVVTMDVEMPGLDGLSALRLLMERFPRPVVMLSSVTAAGAEATVKALWLGAVDFVCKPRGTSALGMSRIADELVEKVKRASRARPRRPLPKAPDAAGVRRSPSSVPGSPAPVPQPASRLVVIGSSTGGPRALAELLANLPGDLPCALVVVQHLPAGFTRSLADRLDRCSPLAVAEARDGDPLIPGRVLVAPGDFHLAISSRRVGLHVGPRLHGLRPAVDPTLESAASAFGPAVLAVVLTGMGDDGTAGARAVKATGGVVLAEAESTCVVYGMPRSVVEAGLADEVVPLYEMASAIDRHVRALKPSPARRVLYAG